MVYINAGKSDSMFKKPSSLVLRPLEGKAAASEEDQPP
jgi:hypothetical protein